MDAALFDLLRALVVGLSMGGAVYGGIRADLRHAVQGVKSAHQRIDDLILRGAKNG